MRVGVVGTGFGSRVVAPVFGATVGCEVVDVVSARDHDAVAALCTRPDLDLVSVHAPPHLHVAYSMLVLDAGHAVLCDKPFGRSAADALELVDAARAAGALGLVNLELRWEPARRHVRDLLRAGAVGVVERVTWLHVSSGSRVPLRPFGWLFDRTAGGGWLGAWGSHALDTLRWWLGDLAVEQAALATVVGERPDADGVLRRCDAEDSVTATLRTASGASVAIDSTFAATASLAPRIVVAGSAGVIESVADGRVTLRSVDGARDVWEAPEPEPGDRHRTAMRHWAEVVRDAVRDGAPDPDAATFSDGLAMARLLDAVRAAAT